MLQVITPRMFSFIEGEIYAIEVPAIAMMFDLRVVEGQYEGGVTVHNIASGAIDAVLSGAKWGLQEAVTYTGHDLFGGGLNCFGVNPPSARSCGETLEAMKWAALEKWSSSKEVQDKYNNIVFDVTTGNLKFSAFTGDLNSLRHMLRQATGWGRGITISASGKCTFDWLDETRDMGRIVEVSDLVEAESRVKH